MSATAAQVAWVALAVLATLLLGGALLYWGVQELRASATPVARGFAVAVPPNAPVPPRTSADPSRAPANSPPREPSPPAPH